MGGCTVQHLAVKSLKLVEPVAWRITGAKRSELIDIRKISQHEVDHSFFFFLTFLTINESLSARPALGTWQPVNIRLHMNVRPRQGREIDAFVIAWLLYPLSGSCQSIPTVIKSEASGIRLAVLIDTGKWCLEVAFSKKARKCFVHPTSGSHTICV